MLKSLFSIAFGLAFGAVLMFVGLLASSAIAAPPQLVCNGAGAEKLQDEIDAASEGDVLEVKGNCRDTNYVIATDRLTLRGVDGATITGDGAAPAITITAAQVTIEGWDMIDGGASHGIVVRASGSALVRDILLISGLDGVQAIEAAFVEINNSHLEASEDGITAAINGSALLIDSDISGNGRFGIVIASGGSANIAGGNTINDNISTGVFASGGQVLVRGLNTVQDNGNDDIACFTFARIIVFQSIASTSNKLRKLDCALIEAFGEPVFETHPLNLVDCAAGDTITEALANGVTNITVRGLCDEFVTVTTSNVTIRGENQSPIGRPVDGIVTGLGPGIGRNTLAVTGAQNVNLINLTITGGRNAVLINRGAAASITTSDIAPDGAGRFGLVVADNASVNLNDTFVSAGSQGGTVATRNGTIRMFRSSSSGGATDKFALILNNSVAYIYGSGFTGGLSAHFNSRISFFEEFLGTFYGDSSISATVLPPMQCSRYSNITAFPGGIVQGMFGPLTNADVFDFDDCRVTIQ